MPRHGWHGFALCGLVEGQRDTGTLNTVVLGSCAAPRSGALVKKLVGKEEILGGTETILRRPVVSGRQ